MIRTSFTPVTGQALGVVADGTVKIVLAAAYIIGAESLSHRLGVATRLMIVCAAALLIAGASEFAYLRSRPMSTYMRLMIGYDTGWTVVTLVALLLASQGSGTAGELWIGYQTLAPLVFAALLGAAGDRKSESDQVGAGNSGSA